uniref:Uncharacterized protein n=1 Tax=Desmodus rotundus TaxID=9430 RepID=K9IW11_DESRO
MSALEFFVLSPELMVLYLVLLNVCPGIFPASLSCKFLCFSLVLNLLFLGFYVLSCLFLWFNFFILVSNILQ